MDKFPLLWSGQPLGELTAEPEPLYTWFTVRCRLPEDGLWCAWAVGEAGELRLGVLEPENGQMSIRRRFSRRMTEPLGRLLRGEVRPAVEDGRSWEAVQEPERLFRTPWLRRQLRGMEGVLTQNIEEGRRLALPYDPQKPYPLAPMFCLSRIRRLGAGKYVIYTFDRREWPVSEKN